MLMQNYSCKNIDCEKEFQRYPSQVRNESRVFCSKACLYKYQEEELAGTKNPNYRHGKHVATSVCECGREKDYRSIGCAICARVGYSKDGTMIVDDVLVAKIVSESSSFEEAAKKLNVSRGYIARRCNKLNLDTKHMKKGRNRESSPDEVFCYATTKTRRNAVVRKYLLREEDVPYMCKLCNLPPIWNGRPLTLQLDHINGDPFDNRKINLRWLCPNCHSQTPNYTGRNRGD